MSTYRDIEVSTIPIERAIIERIPVTTKSGSFEIDNELLTLANGDTGLILGEIFKRIQKLGANMSISYEAASGWVRNTLLVEWSQ